MEILTKIIDWYESTHVGDQIKDVDFTGLFTNPWFIAPFGVMIGYMLYKQSWKNLIIISILVAVWWVSGTDYMNSLVNGDELDISKVLPVMFGGAAILGFVIYLLFGRSD